MMLVAQESSQVGVNRPSAVAAAILLSCIGAAMFLIQPVFLGAAADQFQLNASELGVLAGTELFGVVLASLLAIFWVRRLNWRVVAAGALTVIVLGNVVSSMQTTLQQLVLVRFLVGLFGSGTVYAVTIALLSDTRRPDRNFAFAVAAQVFMSVLAMIGMPYLTPEWGIGGVLIPLAALAILCLPALFWVPERGSKTADEIIRNMRTPRSLVFLALAVQLVWYVGVGGFWPFVERIGVASAFSAADVGEALAMSTALGLGGALFASWVGDGWGRFMLFLVAIAIQVITTSLLIGAKSWWLFVALFSAYQVLWNFAVPFVLGAVSRADVSGRFSVLIPVAQGLGLSIGALVAGALITRAGLASVGYLTAITGVASVGFFFVVLRRLKAAPDSSRGAHEETESPNPIG